MPPSAPPVAPRSDGGGPDLQAPPLCWIRLALSVYALRLGGSTTNRVEQSGKGRHLGWRSKSVSKDLKENKTANGAPTT